MSKCPDCDSIKILGDEGDGKCSTCNGTGAGGLLDDIAHGMIPIGEAPSCDDCGGSGVCQTCDGTGVV